MTRQQRCKLESWLEIAVHPSVHPSIRLAVPAVCVSDVFTRVSLILHWFFYFLFFNISQKETSFLFCWKTETPTRDRCDVWVTRRNWKFLTRLKLKSLTGTESPSSSNLKGNDSLYNINAVSHFISNIPYTCPPILIIIPLILLLTRPFSSICSLSCSSCHSSIAVPPKKPVWGRTGSLPPQPPFSTSPHSTISLPTQSQRLHILVFLFSLVCLSLSLSLPPVFILSQGCR